MYLPGVRRARFEETNLWAGSLLLQGRCAFVACVRLCVRVCAAVAVVVALTVVWGVGPDRRMVPDSQAPES